MRDRRLWRGVAIIAGLAVAGLAVYFSPVGQRFDAAALVRAAREHRDAWWAVPLFFLLYALLDVFFIPTQALSVGAIVVWGWLRGGIIELLAATTGAVFPFLIARSALREPIRARLAGHRAVAAILEREGFTLLLILRVVPVIPYTLLNYLAGLSPLRLWQYVAATLIGMIPSTFVFAYFVEAVIEGVMEPRQIVVRGLLAGLLFAALIIATRLAAPRVRAWVEPTERTVSPPDGEDRG